MSEKKLPAGWYINPEAGKEQYWNGNNWENQSRNKTLPAEVVGTQDYARTSNLAILALVFAFVVPIVGWILGLQAKKQIKRSDGREGGVGLATAAIWVGSLTSIFIFLFLIGMFISLNSSNSPSSEIDNNVSATAISPITAKDKAAPIAEPEYSQIWAKGEQYSKYVGKKYSANLNSKAVEAILPSNLKKDLIERDIDIKHFNNEIVSRQVRELNYEFARESGDQYPDSCGFQANKLYDPWGGDHSASDWLIHSDRLSKQNDIFSAGCYSALGYKITKAPGTGL